MPFDNFLICLATIPIAKFHQFVPRKPESSSSSLGNPLMLQQAQNVTAATVKIILIIVDPKLLALLNNLLRQLLGFRLQTQPLSFMVPII